MKKAFIFTPNELYLFLQNLHNASPSCSTNSLKLAAGNLIFPALLSSSLLN